MKNLALTIFLLIGLIASGQEIRFGNSPGTDDQTITDMSITGNVLSITLEGGNTATANLSAYLDNTDSQTVTDFSLTGNNLSITLSGGNTQVVDLSSLVFTLQDDTVTPAKMANGDFGFFTINNNVASMKIGAVQSVNIADASITGPLIANGAVDSDRIQDNSILEIDLNISNAGTDGQVLSKTGTGFTWITNSAGTDDQNATEVPMTGYVEGTDATAPDSGDNVAEAIAKLKNITDGLTSSTYPSTANQTLITYHSSKVTMHDSIFAPAAQYKNRELNFTVNDTLELGDGVTSANYNRWIDVRRFSKNGSVNDSVYIRVVDNDSLLLHGQLVAVAGGGYSLPVNETGAIKKLDANTWEMSAVANTPAIVDLGPIESMTGIIASWREEDLPDVGQPAGNWVDRVNGFTFVAKGGPVINSDGIGGKEIAYDGVDDAHAVDADPAAIDFVPGTDSFTYAMKLGSLNMGPATELLSKAPVGSSPMQYGMKYQTGISFRVRVGGESFDITDNQSGFDIIVVSVTPTTVEVYWNGVLSGGTQVLSGTQTFSDVLSLASNGGGTSSFGNARIKDVVLFNVAVDAAGAAFINSNL